MGLFRNVYENEEFLCVHRYLLGYKTSDPFYASMVSIITYKDLLILTQDGVREPLDQDPSKSQDWNWEDFG